MSWILWAGLGFLGLFTLHTALTLQAYIKIMSWKRAGITKESALRIQQLFLAYGLFLDATYNWAPWGGSLALMDRPRRGETLFTEHLQRIMEEARPGYTLAVASGYCALLNYFDHNHCRNQSL